METQWTSLKMKLQRMRSGKQLKSAVGVFDLVCFSKSCFFANSECTVNVSVDICNQCILETRRLRTRCRRFCSLATSPPTSPTSCPDLREGSESAGPQLFPCEDLQSWGKFVCPVQSSLHSHKSWEELSNFSACSGFPTFLNQMHFMSLLTTNAL